MKRTAYLFVITVLFSPYLSAEPGEQAYQQGREIILSSGDPAENSRRAAKVFQKAVSAGHLRAHNDLALMYLKGEGVERDTARARELFKTAADEGLTMAQYQYAELLRKGIGSDKDIKSAIAWYERAAGQGHVAAMMRLGALYGDDNGPIEPDYPRAYTWYFLAKQNGGYVSNGKLEILERNMGPRGMDKVKKLVETLAPDSSQS